jgi:phospholipase C
MENFPSPASAAAGCETAAIFIEVRSKPSMLTFRHAAPRCLTLLLVVLACSASVTGDGASALSDAATASSAQSAPPQPPQQQPGQHQQQQQPYTLSDAVAALLAGEPIAHIVVLMMENRSFDHLLGWLHTDYSARVDGLSPGMSLPRDPRNPSKGRVPVTRGGFDVGPDDPKHDFDATRQQIDVDRHSAMDGFVFNALEHKHNESNPVSMFDSESAPIINALAREFAVFDRWHSSIPGPTDPNRAFAMSGTSRGTLENYNGTRWTQQSFFDQLAQYNRSFGAYYQDDLWYAVGRCVELFL